MNDAIAAREDLENIIGTVSLGDPRSGNTLMAWSGLAHELRNLLQAASSAINIIDRSGAIHSPQLRWAIEGAKASVNNASELVLRAVAPARPAPIVESVGDIQSCMAEAAAVARSVLDPAIDLDFVVEADLPPVACDKFGLQNALLNLVLNAREAISASGRIGVRIKQSTCEPAIEICVADNGSGMSAETIARAFDLDFTTKREGQGGIGLPMVERFIRSAGGDIRIDSEPGTGTVVTIRLPSSSPNEKT